MILVVGGIKGGSGKTTVATNLAVLRASCGYKVLLVDADEQKSASDWADQRAGAKEADQNIVTTISLSGKAMYIQLQNMRDDYNDIIVDVGGRDTTSQRSVLSIADIFLIPFKPRSLDIWTLGSVKAMIQQLIPNNPKLQCFAMINQADSKGADNDAAQDILNECDIIRLVPASLGQRKAFSNAASDGLGVTEIKSIDRKAENEMYALYEYIYGVQTKSVVNI